MLFLPSLLEYNLEDLNRKIALLESPPASLISLQSSSGFFLGVHIDIIGPDFAAQRGIKPTLPIKKIFESLFQSFSRKNVFLSVHLMFEKSDYNQLAQINMMQIASEGWFVKLFLPVDDIDDYGNYFAQGSLAVRTGVWFDLNQWYDKDHFDDRIAKIFNYKEVLLMTVPAGLAGQTLKEDVKNQAIAFVSNFPSSTFTFDGGWKILDLNQLSGLKGEMISYTDFWKNQKP
jgi:pentose-5-phosphate-3-epimerase